MRFLQTILVFFCAPCLLFAQEKLNPLQAPTSPAAGILELQPKVVLEPKSYQALETALYSNFVNSENNTFIPTDFALEFTPYWTQNHGLALTEYLYPKSITEQWIRNSSFSWASTQNFRLGDSTSSNGLAFGYRTTFYFPNNTDKNRVENYIEKLDVHQLITSEIVLVSEKLILDSIATTKEEFLEKIKKPLTALLYNSTLYKDPRKTEAAITKILTEAKSLPQLDPDTPDDFLDTFYNTIDTTIEADLLFAEFKKYVKERQGLSIDLAFATLLNFPTNNFEFSYIPKSSVWATPTYRFSNELGFLKILGVLRYEWYHTDYYQQYFPETITYKNNIDYGISLASEFDRFTLQFEVVGRTSSTHIPVETDTEGNVLFRKEKSDDLQYIGSFHYNLTDAIVLSYSLGNRFVMLQDPENTLVSLLSLNFGFGAPTLEDLYLKK